MVDQVFALMGSLFVFAVILGVTVYALAYFVSHDSTSYDMEFLWDNRFTREELELE
ncbi:hypothetical protein [Paenibacillus aestuarii]|uniref:YtzI protein n=1 Tax=Paenibacillus aestuarii TaxID=516965 RepID=A0ABW0KAZ2_9BACL|nr:hypothetical protein [Paenibacillus aestuarii]